MIAQSQVVAVVLLLNSFDNRVPDHVCRPCLDGHEEGPADGRIAEGEQHHPEAPGCGPGRLATPLLALVGPLRATGTVRWRRRRRGRYCITAQRGAVDAPGARDHSGTV